MKFYRWLYLVSAAMILSACGGPVADAPAAVAEGDPLIDQLITEAETLGVDLSVQTNSKNVRYIKVGKKVEGYAPHDAKYKFILACKKGKKHVVVIKTELYVGTYKEFKVPDYYWDCFAVEYGTVGDYVKFDIYQSHDYKWTKSYHTYKGMYEEPKHMGSYGRAAASKTLYLTKKYVKIDVANKFKSKPEPKTVTVHVRKEFAYHRYPGHGDKVFVGIYCDGREVGRPDTELTQANGYSYKFDVVYDDRVRGKNCYVREYYADSGKDNELEKVNFNYYDPYGGADGDGTRTVIDSGYVFDSKTFVFDPKHPDVKVKLTNYFKYVRPEPEKVTIHIRKFFDDHRYPGHGDKVFVGIYCGSDEVGPGGTELTQANGYSYKFEVAYSLVKERDCYVKEFYQDEGKDNELVKVDFDYDRPYDGADGYKTPADVGSGYVVDSNTFRFKSEHPDVKVDLKNYFKKHDSSGPA